MSTIVVFCNPLLDISASVPHSLLDKYALQTGTAILAEEKHIPLYEELKKNYPVEYIAGGSGQNTIRAAQWMLQKPNSTAFVGCIGKDENGVTLKQKASADGVAIHYLEDPTTPTGTCAALVVDKERTLVANLAAANCYKKEHFDTSEIQSLIQAAQIIYISGFFLTVSPETIVAAAEIAARSGKTFAMNVSAPFIVDFFWDKFEAVFDKVDYLFGNEHEFAALGKKLGFGENLNEVVEKLATFKRTGKSRVVVCTQGSSSTSAFNGTELLTVPVPSVPKEEIVDVNGAGDSFVGGFLAGLLLGKDITRCIEAGHYCAGVTIRVSGTSFENRTPTFAW